MGETTAAEHAEPAEQLVLSRREGAITRITLNRPRVLNALTRQMADTTARMISITVIGGSCGATRKPKLSTATPSPPIRPSATPPRRIPIRIAVRTSAN